jgi:hypothetical protein
MTITCFAPNPPECGDGVFSAVDKTKAKLFVLPNAIAAYKAADQWKDFGDNILPIGGPTAIQQVANQEGSRRNVQCSGRRCKYDGGCSQGETTLDQERFASWKDSIIQESYRDIERR